MFSAKHWYTEVSNVKNKTPLKLEHDTLFSQSIQYHIIDD